MGKHPSTVVHELKSHEDMGRKDARMGPDGFLGPDFQFLMEEFPEGCCKGSVARGKV